MKNLSLIQNDFKNDLFLTFSLADKKYSVQAKQIEEIIQIPHLEIVEKQPPFIAGLLNLRGKIISVIDIRHFLGLKKNNYSIDNHILIFNQNGNSFGIIIDIVEEVSFFNSQNLEQVPYSNQENNLIKGLYKKDEDLTAFLNIEKLSELIIEKAQDINQESSTTSLLPQDEKSIAILEKRASSLKQEIKLELEKIDYTQDQFISFSINNELYCIGLKYVKEFAKINNTNITHIPCVPNYIIGIISLRGEFITIVDIRSFLNLEPKPFNNKAKIIVLKNNHFQIGIAVDEVFNLINIPIEKLEQSSQHLERNSFAQAEVVLENKKVITALNLEKLLKDERLFIDDRL